MNRTTTIHIADEPHGYVLVFNREQIETLQTICDFVRDDDDEYAEGEFADDLYAAIFNALTRTAG